IVEKRRRAVAGGDSVHAWVGFVAIVETFGEDNIQLARTAGAEAIEKLRPACGSHPLAVPFVVEEIEGAMSAVAPTRDRGSFGAGDEHSAVENAHVGHILNQELVGCIG